MYAVSVLVYVCGSNIETYWNVSRPVRAGEGEREDPAA